jgi:hypothetical protein
MRIKNEKFETEGEAKKRFVTVFAGLYRFLTLFNGLRRKNIWMGEPSDSAREYARPTGRPAVLTLAGPEAGVPRIGGWT